METEKITEVLKCKNDILYFAEKYFKYIDIEKGIAGIQLFPNRERDLLSMKENRFNIFLNSRQSGSSTTLAIFVVWSLLFNSDKNIVFVSNNLTNSKNFLEKIYLAIYNLPDFFMFSIVNRKKMRADFSNSSSFIIHSPESICGVTANMLIVENCSFIKSWQGFWQSMAPVIDASKESKIILSSSACNKENHFQHIWEDAINKKNCFIPNITKWDDIPYRNGEWKKYMETIIDEKTFRREYECLFE